MHYYDIIIVGAGPAGLTAANELIERGIQGSKILLVDMGLDITERMQSREMGLDKFNTFGLGGAGLFSDGKLHVVNEKYGLFPTDPAILKLWEALPNSEITEDETQELYKYAYDLLSDLDVNILQDEVTEDAISQMREIFEQVGIYFQYYESRQIEQSDLPKVIMSFRDRLEASGVTFQLSTKVLEVSGIEAIDKVKHLKCRHVQQDTFLSCRYLVLAVGKMGMKWLVKQAENLDIARVFRPIEIGIRVEVPNSVLDPFTKVHRDLQLIRKINADTLVQTFCTCHGGIVSLCQYDDLIVLGGYTDKEKSPNTNFALLVKMDMKKVNVLSYGFSVIRATNVLGRGKPLVQRLGDMKKGVASDNRGIKNNPIQPTLTAYTPGNITQAFPKFIVDALLETLVILDKVIPGINSDSTIISAPCLEFCYQKILVSKNMETSRTGVYVAGDAAGYESGIIPSMASGILAARGIADQISKGI